MLHTLRLLLLGVHFLVAGAINMVIVLLRPFNPDNSSLCGGCELPVQFRSIHHG
jgi:1-acyl-sn-glycerol-3-phosphate acyltransferase